MAHRQASRAPGDWKRQLYFMAAGFLVLFLGIGLVFFFLPRPRAELPDPLRTMILLYDETKAGQEFALLGEEPVKGQQMTLTAFRTPEAVHTAFSGGQCRAAEEALSKYLQQPIHHRSCLSYLGLSYLVDAAQGLTLSGRQLDGSDALTYLRQAENQTPEKASALFMALAEAVALRGVNMPLSKKVQFASQVSTDLDPSQIRDMLGRWSNYPDREIRTKE